MERSNSKKLKRSIIQNIVLGILVIVVLVAGSYLRLVGVNWDEDQHMHPDERFLSLVQVSILPVDSLSEYFNTAESNLNPANRGYTFFVYGTLPIFITRYIGEALGQTDYNAITLLGRRISAIFDICTILIVFFIGKRLYNKWTGLLGAVFYSFAVLPIQLSHFATVDAISNTFSMIVVYAGVWILTRTQASPVVNREIAEDGYSSQPTMNRETSVWIKIGKKLEALAPYLLFGVGLGMATASKINAVVFALILPFVEGVRILRLSEEERKDALLPAIRNLILAAIVSFIVFRICQPYAFTGPGFFNFGIDQNWWQSLQSLRSQASGEVDFPPALQWARRSISFSWENLVAWGLGWPLGIFAWLAYLGMGWLIIRKNNWDKHLPLWLFTGLYFAWQSFSWVRTMRYQVLIYPLLALIAGWGLVRMMSIRRTLDLKFIKIDPRTMRVLGVILTVIIVLATAVWAFSFSQIYVRTHTRVAASEWIYQNIPSALTLEYELDEGVFEQPLPYRAGDIFTASEPYSQPFRAVADGVLQSVTFPYMLDPFDNGQLKQVMLTVEASDNRGVILATAMVESTFASTENEYRGASYTFTLQPTLSIEEGQLYYLQLYIVGSESMITLNGSPSLAIVTNQGMSVETPLPRILQGVRYDNQYTMEVRALQTGAIHSVNVPFLVDQAGSPGLKDLTIILQVSSSDEINKTATIQSVFKPAEDIRGETYHFDLDPPLWIQEGQAISVTLSTETQDVRLVPHGYAPVHESSWDDALPYPVDGFSPYNENGGIYRGDLNFEMYWADDPLKLEKFETNLDLADYIFISSNRQWGTTTRVPERYLLTTAYYRELIGCPEDQEVTWCYSVAKPGMFEGSLGFELVETFDSNPRFGPLEFNTQFAEEAFTVYDHPKVLIFKKTSDYDAIKVREILRSVDLNQVLYFTPGEADQYEGIQTDQKDDPRHNLMLPEDQLEEQRTGGTWSELYNRESILNTSPFAAVLAFYLLVFLLGVICYPIVRLALPGLSDRGYPLSRLAGLLLLAFVVWLLGSLGIPYTRLTIVLVILSLILISVIFIILQKDTLLEEIRVKWRYFLMVEILALVAFTVFLLIRMGNPDLWHPWKGGEKPMDFSYLNAVLKSTTFPPYDPWFAGGYINYYYYGFVIVGTPIKLLGIIPATAYNIVLPIWFALLVLGGFSVGWNLYLGIPRSKALSWGEQGKKPTKFAIWAGLATAVGLAVLGNLGTVKLIIQGFQQLASGGGVIDEAALIQKIVWAFRGLKMFLSGIPMPFYPGDWYWFPSRVIPGEPITEFPFFTFIYADLHAHLIAFPLTVFAISWSLSVVLNQAKWCDKKGRLKILGIITGILLGAVVIGALRPTNTWDFYTYIVFALIALSYSIIRYYRPCLKLRLKGGQWIEKIGIALLICLGFVLLSLLLYQPFSYWYGQGYTQIDTWKGDRTPLSSYFTHWGLFLFVIISWMGWETYHWMKTTPISAMKPLEKYRTWIYAGLILFLIALLLFLIEGVVVAVVALPLGVWAVLLMLRKESSEGQRFLLFMIGTAVTLTLVVEMIYLTGDIGRMNTVFKFYLQSWILFSLSAGVCLVWLVKSFRFWNRRLLFFEQLILFVLVVSAALFTLLGTADKIRDRMAPEAPQTLDGMSYMADATFNDLGIQMELVEDYQAIQWMQDNIQGSPVILEGQAYEYRWGNRFTIYTGLPGVVGWNWHQRQQRAILRDNRVQERVDEVNAFYMTDDISYVTEFLDRYNVAYIVVGQLEQIFYPGAGLDKFPAFTDQLWEVVYDQGDTIIYKVIR